jgi:hypothetical protein
MNGRLAFNLLLLATAAYFVWSATGYEPQARYIPILLGVMVLGLQAWVTIREAVATEPPAGAESAEEPRPPDELRRVATMGGWMLLYLTLFVLLGTLAATFLFILLFLLGQKGVRWWTALAVAGTMSATIWLVFVKLMHFELYAGILFGATLPPL